MPAARSSSKPEEPPDPDYDRQAIFDQDGPLHPEFMAEAIRTLLRAMPIDPQEPQPWADRRRHAAMLGLASLNPRDEIEVMLAVQALSAFYAASACWHLGMNHHVPNGDNVRHVTTAGTAARTFDALLRALERRQAKPLSVPPGRPSSRVWPRIDPGATIETWARRCGLDLEEASATSEAPPHVIWSPDALALAEDLRRQDEAALSPIDVASVDGVLPGGGIVVPESPTPEQEAYIARRLGLLYRREYEANKRQGSDELPKLRTIRPGDLIP